MADPSHPRRIPAAVALALAIATGVGLLAAAHSVGLRPRWVELLLVVAGALAVVETKLLRAALADARERGERAARAEQQVQALLDNAPAAIYFRDRDDRFVVANDTASRALDPGRPSIEGQTLDQILEPELAARVRAAEAPVLEEGREVRFEQRMPHADGTEHTFLVSKFPVRDADGEIAGLGGVTIDVTDLKRAEQRVQDAEERFRRAFDDAPIGMAIVSLDGRYLQVNDALCTILGRTAEDLQETTVQALTHPEDVDESARALQALLAGDHQTYELEKRYVRPDGEPVWVSLHATLVRDADGRPATLLGQVQDITRRRVDAGRLQYLADHDPLTGLLNRRRFEQELDRQVQELHRYGPDGALLVLDLDHFKLVNDTLGHNAGDELLIAVASTLRERLRTTDVVARLGGDEFAVLLPRVTRAEAETVAAAIVTGVGATISAAAPRGVTCSLGIAMLEAPLASGEEALINADLAMYEAKEEGRARWAHYSSELYDEPRMKTRLGWVERIRDALDEDRLLLVAQPIVDLRTNEISRHELLLRMRDERGRIVPPGAFLHVAERFDVIQDVDRWVVGRAIDLLAEHHARGTELVLEVNLSGKSLAEERLLLLVERRLAETGVPPSSLIFEVTETAAVANMQEARAFSDRLRALGCRFALDDFGAGFGSFFYLKHLPFDYLKIDGEFIADCVRNETDRLVVAAVVGIARGMGKETIAEFVPDEQTQRFLRRQGVDFAQGYHVGRPLPLGEAFPAKPSYTTAR